MRGLISPLNKTMKNDMKPIVDLMNNSIESLNKLITKKNTMPFKYEKLSEFGEFLVGLRGYLLYKGDRLLDTWEAFEMTNKTAKEIINEPSIFSVHVDYDYTSFMIKHNNK